MGGRESRAALRILKILFMVHCDFEKVSKSTFSKYSFGREEGLLQKQYSVDAIDSVDNYGRQLF